MSGQNAETFHCSNVTTMKSLDILSRNLRNLRHKLNKNLYPFSIKKRPDIFQTWVNVFMFTIQLIKCVFIRISFQDKKYLIITAADSPKQDLMQFVPACNDFIHAARLRGGHVLVHWYEL